MNRRFLLALAFIALPLSALAQQPVNVTPVTNADPSVYMNIRFTDGVNFGALPTATDDAVFSVGSGKGAPIMGFADETSADSVEEGDTGVLRMTLARILKVTLTDANGDALSFGTDYTQDNALTIASTSGPMNVFRASTAAPTNVSTDDDAVLGWALPNGSQVVNLAAGGNLITATGNSLNVQCGNCSGSGAVHVDNAVFTATTDDVAPAGALYDTTPPSITDGNLGAFRMDSDRVLFTKFISAPTIASITNALPAGTNNIGDVDVASLPNEGQQTAANSISVVLASDVHACSDLAQVDSVAISTATSGNVELVAISGSEVVYVCGFDVTAAADVTVQFVSGTGTACATGETNKTGAYQLNAASGAGIRGIARPNGGAPQFKSASGEAVCIELSGAVQVDGLLTYVQR